MTGQAPTPQSDYGSQPVPVTPRQVTYAELRCIEVDLGDRPDIPVILCHGYGASARDLAGLSVEWKSMLGESAARFRFVFPQAPVSLADQGMPDGWAWWPLNMARLLDMAGASRFDELHDEEPPGLNQARQHLSSAVAEILSSVLGDTRESGDTSIRYVLGGFSQGAMLSLDTVLRSDLPHPTTLFQYSGTLICKSIWQAAVESVKGIAVLQSHGTIDPILPIESAHRLADLLRGGGVDLKFHSFHGPHTIDPETIALSAEFLRSAAQT